MIDEKEISSNQQQKRFPRHLIFINLCDWQDSSISDFLSFIIIIKSLILTKLPVIFFFQLMQVSKIIKVEMFCINWRNKLILSYFAPIHTENTEPMIGSW